MATDHAISTLSLALRSLLLDARPGTGDIKDAGVELYLGDRANLSLTTYSQTADGLIQQVVANRRMNARTGSRTSAQSTQEA